MTINTTAKKKSFLDGKKMWFFFAAAAAILAAILILLLMSKVISRDTYYVLNTEVMPRYQITESMLEQRDVPAGGIPQNTLGLVRDTNGVRQDLSAIVGRWAKYTLLPGDVITAANTTPMEEEIKLTAGLPSDFVITSFSTDPNNSAGGNVRRGDYVDIAVISSDSSITGSSSTTATWVLQHVLVIDANAGAESVGVDPATGTVSGIEGRNTVPTLYTVGLTPDNALRLMLAQQAGSLYVVLSSVDSISGDINPNPRSVSIDEILSGEVPDGGWGTDSEFGFGGNVVTTPSNPRPTGPSTPSTPSEPAPSSTPTTEPSPTTEPEPTETITPIVPEPAETPVPQETP